MNEKARSSETRRLMLTLRGTIPQIIAVLLAFLIGAIILLATGHSPIDAYVAVLKGAFGDVYGIGQTLTQATPIIFTALAFIFAFKCGLFNIGAEGQLLIGGFTAALAGIYFGDLPIYIHLPFALLVGATGGALWGFIPGILKAKLGAHEVITSMMLSYVALYITSYMVNYPFIAPPGWVAQTVPVAPSAELPRILSSTQLSASILIAIGMAAILTLVFNRTVLGYEVRAVGLNTAAAESNGINVKNTMIIAFIISGALAGLGGAGEILGVHRRFISGFSPGYGFDGLAVGLIGGLNPIGTIFAAILIGALRAGGMTMNTVTGVPIDIVSVLQGLVVLFVAAPKLITYLSKKGVALPRALKPLSNGVQTILSKIKRTSRKGGS